MIQLHNITLTLAKNTHMERKLFENFNLNIASEDFLIIIGGNGAGKTTLLNLINGIIQPDSGTVFIDEENITQQPIHTRAQKVTQVAQDPRSGTIEQMTIFENLSFALKRGQSRLFSFWQKNRYKSFFKERLALLDMDLESRLDEKVKNLSGGQRQALSLIMAMLADYNVLLLDEITAALDPQTAERIMMLAHTLVQRQSKTCIMVTHNMPFALQYGNRLIVLREGKIIREYNGYEKSLLTLDDLHEQFQTP